MARPAPTTWYRTKVRPLWVDFDPESEGADELEQRLHEGVDAYREEYEAYFSRHEEAGRGDVRPEPEGRPYRRASGSIAAAKNAKEADLSQDFVPQGHRRDARRPRSRRLRVPDRGGDLRGRVLASGALQAHPRPAARRARGQGRLRHRWGRRHRKRRSPISGIARVPASWSATSTRRVRQRWPTTCRARHRREGRRDGRG